MSSSSKPVLDDDEAAKAAFDECATVRAKQLEWIAKILQVAQSQPAECGILSTVGRLCLRGLYPSEVTTLQQQQACHCKNWSQVKLLLPTEQHRMDQSSFFRQRVSKTNFQGLVVLICDWNLAQAPGASSWQDGLPKGLHSNLLVGNSCILHLDARIHGNTSIQNTYIGPNATLVNCGVVQCTKPFQSTLGITVGPESGGGRHLQLTPEATMLETCHEMVHCHGSAQDDHDDNSLTINVICGGCTVVRDTPTIDGVFLYGGASIQAATSVTQAMLFPAATICNASTASAVSLQWNASITDNSSVSETLLMEQAHVGPKCIVASSVLGPDVHVSCGEVHASIIGPNTNAHHQSLVIGVLWPLGRGNVGYGANVGSNHTGRIPDQETVSGEGTFWGLSTVVKFPVNLQQAPYTVIAAGTTLPPQRICMPFSLVVAIEGGRNQIVPGWLLQSSPYTLSRNQQKYATRRKATRHKSYTGWNILRPETIDLCLWARQSLQSVSETKQVYYSDREVSGIGANELTEKGRAKGIVTYSQCIQLYALRGLLQHLYDRKETLAKESLDAEFGKAQQPNLLQTFIHTARIEWDPFPWQVDTAKEWSYQKQLLQAELPMGSSTSVSDWIGSMLLPKLSSLEQDYANRLYKSKHRDDVRGAQVIPGYAQSHKAAEADAVVQAARDRAQETQERVKELVDIILHQNQTPSKSKL